MTAGPIVIGGDDVLLDEWDNGLDLGSPPNSGGKTVS
jgi:hypothetical protein